MNIRRAVAGSVLGLVATAAFATPASAQVAAACGPIDAVIKDGILCVVATCTDDFVDTTDVDEYVSCLA